MLTKERFAQGMTVQQYLDQMGTNKETFMKFLSEIKIKPEDKTALARLGKKLKVMVITEDWCGDALYNVPVLFKLVEGNPDVELRVFLRDKNPDLMDQYLNKGQFRSIPVFAFFDERFHEVARLLERPQKLTEEIEARMLEARKAIRAEKIEPWRQEIVNEVRTLLNACGDHESDPHPQSRRSRGPHPGRHTRARPLGGPGGGETGRGRRELHRCLLPHGRLQGAATPHHRAGRRGYGVRGGAGGDRGQAG